MRYIKWGSVLFISLTTLFYLGFVVQPYYHAWKYDAELVSETIWPTGALRNPVFNGKWLIYLQSVNENNIVLREILPSGESKDYTVPTHMFRNVYVSYFSRDISVNRPIIVLWGEDKTTPKKFLIMVKELGEEDIKIGESFYPLGSIRVVTKDYILGQPTFYEEGKTVNHPFILDWKGGSLKPLPISGSAIEALAMNSGKIYYSKDNYLYVINHEDLKKNKLVKFPSKTNSDNWILVTPEADLIWRSFDKEGANFTVYNPEENKKRIIANGFKEWVTEYSLWKGKVVFSSSKDENSDLDIFSADIATGNVEQLFKAEGSQYSPHIYGQYLYWEESLNNPLSVIIRGLDFLGIHTWYKIHRLSKIHVQSYIFRKKVE